MEECKRVPTSLVPATRTKAIVKFDVDSCVTNQAHVTKRNSHVCFLPGIPAPKCLVILKGCGKL